MGTRNVHFTSKQSAFIDERVRSGRYGTGSEVVREALRLLMDKHEQDAAYERFVRCRRAPRATGSQG